MMIGLDFGSTTSRAMIASAYLERNPITERMELGKPELIYRSDAILTPFEEGELCTEAINNCLEQWLEESGIDCDQLFSGGVIITGLAAEKQNARAIADSKTLCRNIAQYIPEYQGRATVYGLALHSAELSGNTLFMPKPEQLPVNDLPIVVRLNLHADENRIKRAIELTRKTHNGGCIRITLKVDNYPSFKELKGFGGKLAETLSGFPKELPLLLLVPKDFGKVIGNYASHWGKLPVNLMAVDEVPDRKAGYVSLGKVKNLVIPVYFYGMH